MRKPGLKRQSAVVVILILSVVAGASASSNDRGRPLYRNLQVLPKNVSSKVLQGLMVDDFQDGLGVTCGFCHANARDGHGLDFASDEKPEKLVARNMMRMTLGINKKYLKIKAAHFGEGTSLVVTCMTCHNGRAFPESADTK